ncbi:MAG TPA: carbon monoxide dehydrogenase subunit G, partial [Alphaproteobacteria bacterium]|nr:carbon monoxide dehydrogenase subunit G [Alphaproteobacteria bacterium]
MELREEKRIPAGRDVVWKALNDPEVLRQCIPGCESVEKRSDTEFTAKVTVAVGPVKAKFTGEVTLSDIDPPNGYTISGKGSGGVAGFGKGSAVVKLRDEGADTVLAYTVQASVGGKLAQIGQRLVDSTAKKLADEFFANFVKAVAQQGTAAAAPAAEPVSVPPPPQAAAPA